MLSCYYRVSKVVAIFFLWHLKKFFPCKSSNCELCAVFTWIFFTGVWFLSTEFSAGWWIWTNDLLLVRQALFLWANPACPQGESNPHRWDENPVSYPLDYGDQVSRAGVEPATLGLKGRCSTSWANGSVDWKYLSINVWGNGNFPNLSFFLTLGL